VFVLLLAVLYPWYPADAVLREGRTAPFALVAPRDVSFDSAVRTAQARAAAAAAVTDVLVLDPSVRERQLAELGRQLDGIARARADSGLAASARESAIRAVAGTLLSPRSAETLGAASAADWELVAGEARSVLGRTLSGTIREGELPAARQRAAGLVTSALSADQQQAAADLVAPLVAPTLVVDAARTAQLRDEASRNQAAVHVSHARGERLVAAGQVLSAADVEVLAAAGLRTGGPRATDVAASALVALLVAAALGAYVRLLGSAELAGLRRRALLALLLLLPALGAKLALPALLPDQERHFLAYVLPLAAAPMAAAVLLELGAALMLATLVAAVAAFVAAALPLASAAGGGTLDVARVALAVLASGTAGAFVVARAERLQRFLLAGASAGAAGGAALLAVWALDADRRALDLALIGVAAGTSGVLAALVAVGSFVLFARPFGIVTRVELMELAQLNHPLLRRLQDEAPGTFQHSIVVGNLAERAAERIGAHALLVRIGAYYHDIGKLGAPAFYIENSGEETPHRTLDPQQSARVILQHVSRGVELARQAGLPDAVVQFIPQHHGTRLVSFFYRQAAAADPDVDPEQFRYPGPRPQSRETALVMLADSAEATVRASGDRSPERIRAVVDGLVRERLEEGQFDECDISLRDLRVVVESYAATLNAVYHPRVQYPEPTERELESRRVERVPERGEATGGALPRLRRGRAREAAAGAATDGELSEDSP
jgi:putative nucleotidyltransferase with HDIG domain